VSAFEEEAPDAQVDLQCGAGERDGLVQLPAVCARADGVADAADKETAVAHSVGPRAELADERHELAGRGKAACGWPLGGEEVAELGALVGGEVHDHAVEIDADAQELAGGAEIGDFGLLDGRGQSGARRPEKEEVGEDEGFREGLDAAVDVVQGAAQTLWCWPR